MSRAYTRTPEHLTVKYEYVPMGNWYRYRGYEEYLTGLEAFLYRGTIWMHRNEDNPEEIANREIWDLLGFPRATGRFISEDVDERNVRSRHYIPEYTESQYKNGATQHDDAAPLL